MGSGGQSQQTQLPKEARPYAREGMRGVFDYYMPGGQIGQYTGPDQSVAALMPDQQQAFDMTRDFAQQVPGMYAPYSPDKVNQYLDPYVKRAQESTIAQFQDTIAPGILNRAAQTGTLGGSGHGLATAAAQDTMMHQLGDIDVGIREPAFEAAQNRGLQAAEGQTQAQMAANQALLGTGGQQQQQQQNVLDTIFGNAYRAWQYPQQAFGQLGGDFGSFLGNQSTTKVSGGK